MAAFRPLTQLNGSELAEALAALRAAGWPIPPRPEGAMESQARLVLEQALAIGDAQLVAETLQLPFRLQGEIPKLPAEVPLPPPAAPELTLRPIGCPKLLADQLLCLAERLAQGDAEPTSSPVMSRVGDMGDGSLPFPGYAVRRRLELILAEHRLEPLRMACWPRSYRRTSLASALLLENQTARHRHWPEAAEVEAIRLLLEPRISMAEIGLHWPGWAWVLLSVQDGQAVWNYLSRNEALEHLSHTGAWPIQDGIPVKLPDPEVEDYLLRSWREEMACGGIERLPKEVCMTDFAEISWD